MVEGSGMCNVLGQTVKFLPRPLTEILRKKRQDFGIDELESDKKICGST